MRTTFQTVAQTNRNTRGGLMLITALVITLAIVAYTKYNTSVEPSFVDTSQPFSETISNVSNESYQNKDFGPSIPSQRLIVRARELSTEYDFCMSEGWVVAVEEIEVCGETGCKMQEIQVRQVRRPDDCKALLAELQSMDVKANECEGTPDGELCVID